jgi:hypothetical protein
MCDLFTKAELLMAEARPCYEHGDCVILDLTRQNLPSGHRHTVFFHSSLRAACLLVLQTLDHFPEEWLAALNTLIRNTRKEKSRG